MEKLHNEFPWKALLEFSYATLGLSPDIFWLMTPYEWSLTVSGRRNQHAISYTSEIVSLAELNELRRCFPD